MVGVYGDRESFIVDSACEQMP